MASSRGGESRRRAFHEAVQRGDRAGVKRMLAEVGDAKVMVDAPAWYRRAKGDGGRAQLEWVGMEKRSYYREMDCFRPLWLACFHGNVEMAQLLIHRGADVRGGDNRSLYWAFRRHHYDLVWLLVRLGADVHARQESALRSACGQGRLDLARFLIEEHRADVHADDDGALRRACEQGHLDVARFLIEEHGADVHADDDAALRGACERGCVDIARFLIDEHGGNVHAGDDAALRGACEQGRVDIVRFLVEEHGADVHADDNRALIDACKGGHLDLVRFLVVEHGANPQRGNALHLAVCQARDASDDTERDSFKEICRCLLQRDPTLVAVSDVHGRFPMQLADRDTRQFLREVLPPKVAKGVGATVPPPAVEVHIVGFGGAGKTRLSCTLLRRAYPEAPADSPIDPDTGRRLYECTLGVDVVTESQIQPADTRGQRRLSSLLRRKRGRVRIWDYGGQREFRANIATRLPRATMSLVLVVVSLAAQEASSAVATLRYFLAMVRASMGLMGPERTADVFVVATHIDQIESTRELRHFRVSLERMLAKWYEDSGCISSSGADGDEANSEPDVEHSSQRVFYVNATASVSEDADLAALQNAVHAAVMARELDARTHIPKYCETVLRGLAVVRESEDVAPCVRLKEATARIRDALTGMQEDVPQDMLPFFLEHLERCGEILLLRSATGGGDDGDTWAALNLHTLMNHLVGHLQADPKLLHASRRGGSRTRHQHVRQRARELQARNELVLSPEDLATLTGCDTVFGNTTSADERAVLTIQLLEQLNLCVRVKDETMGHVLYFPSLSRDPLATLTATERREWVSMESGFYCTGRRVQVPDRLAGLVFPPGTASTLQAKTVRFLRRIWRIEAPEADADAAAASTMRVQMCEDCLTVRRFDDGRCTVKVVVRTRTLDNFGDDRDAMAALHSLTYREMIDIVVGTATKGRAALRLLERLQQHVLMQLVPWLSVHREESELVMRAGSIGLTDMDGVECSPLSESASADRVGCIYTPRAMPAAADPAEPPPPPPPAAPPAAAQAEEKAVVGEALGFVGAAFGKIATQMPFAHALGVGTAPEEKIADSQLSARADGRDCPKYPVLVPLSTTSRAWVLVQDRWLRDRFRLKFVCEHCHELSDGSGYELANPKPEARKLRSLLQASAKHVDSLHSNTGGSHPVATEQHAAAVAADFTSNIVRLDDVVGDEEAATTVNGAGHIASGEGGETGGENEQLLALLQSMEGIGPSGRPQQTGLILVTAASDSVMWVHARCADSALHGTNTVARMAAVAKAGRPQSVPPLPLCSQITAAPAAAATAARVAAAPASAPAPAPAPAPSTTHATTPASAPAPAPAPAPAAAKVAASAAGVDHAAQYPRLRQRLYAADGNGVLDKLHAGGVSEADLLNRGQQVSEAFAGDNAAIAQTLRDLMECYPCVHRDLTPGQLDVLVVAVMDTVSTVAGVNS